MPVQRWRARRTAGTGPRGRRPLHAKKNFIHSSPMKSIFYTPLRTPACWNSRHAPRGGNALAKKGGRETGQSLKLGEGRGNSSTRKRAEAVLEGASGELLFQTLSQPRFSAPNIDCPAGVNANWGVRQAGSQNFAGEPALWDGGHPGAYGSPAMIFTLHPPSAGLFHRGQTLHSGFSLFRQGKPSGPATCCLPLALPDRRSPQQK